MARVSYDKRLLALFRAFYKCFDDVDSHDRIPRLSDSQICCDPRSALEECLEIEQTKPKHMKRLVPIQRDLAEDFELLQLKRPARWSRLARLRLTNRRLNSICQRFMFDTVLLPLLRDADQASLLLNRIQ